MWLAGWGWGECGGLGEWYKRGDGYRGAVGVGRRAGKGAPGRCKVRRVRMAPFARLGGGGLECCGGGLTA